MFSIDALHISFDVQAASKAVDVAATATLFGQQHHFDFKTDCTYEGLVNGFFQGVKGLLECAAGDSDCDIEIDATGPPEPTSSVVSGQGGVLGTWTEYVGCANGFKGYQLRRDHEFKMGQLVGTANDGLSAVTLICNDDNSTERVSAYDQPEMGSAGLFEDVMLCPAGQIISSIAVAKKGPFYKSRVGFSNIRFYCQPFGDETAPPVDAVSNSSVAIPALFIPEENTPDGWSSVQSCPSHQRAQQFALKMVSTTCKWGQECLLVNDVEFLCEQP